LRGKNHTSVILVNVTAGVAAGAAIISPFNC
jgi:hypothetical protein